MLSYFLGLAASVADPAAGAAPAARIQVGGYVPAACRAAGYDPGSAGASLPRLCTGGATVAVSETHAAGTRLVRVLVSPR